ncbi:DUF7504 family protein [Halomicrobium salinisoli]|uniref:DUF7504 family protein n=1 Tax=Halomicrobium salinisoli TaxID=2878391 RepID=UPI001CF06E62|nr:HalOD1 output domain-containing protein [Halomicrobium salinisoli]
MAVLNAAADALDTDALELPTLNDRVDPDYLARIPDATTADDGVRVAVEVSFGDVRVLLTDEGRVAAYPDEEAGDLRPTATADHDWTGPGSILDTIADAVATADGDAGASTEELLRRVDPETIDRVVRPMAGGTERTDSRLLLSIDGYEVTVAPDGRIAVEPSLSALERAGAALLVVGSVPEQEFDRAVSALLGGPEEERWPVFVLHGRDVETASRRLSMADASPASATVLDHRARARSGAAATAGDGGETDPLPSVIPVAEEMDALPDAVRETVGGPETTTPGELRLCVDSLDAMVEASGVDSVRQALEPLCETVREHRGVGQFLLPGDADDDAVCRLAPAFDAVVTLRTGDAGVEQRWRLTGTGHETSWFPVR